jgi:hypothetical protein
MSVAFSEHYDFGRAHELHFRRHLARTGFHVVCVNSDQEEKGSPKVHTRNGKLVAADILGIDERGVAMWVEVKAKSVPHYHYMSREFQHGVDLRLFRHYRELASRADFWFVVCEQMTPTTDEFLPPDAPRCADGARDFKDYINHLVPGPVWLAAHMKDVVASGLEVKNSNRGMWNWPRNIMRRIEVQP